MIENINQEFLQLMKIVENLQQRVTELEQSNQVLVRSNTQLIEWIKDMIAETEDYKRNAYFEIQDNRMQNVELWYPHIEPGEVVIEKIVKERKSLARFGDGEFAAIAGRVRHKFQTEADSKLGERLHQVLNAEEDNLLIGIADNYGNLEKYNEQAKREIRRYLNPNVRKEHLALLNKNTIYYDAYVTRPYVMYADNNTDAPRRRFAMLKQIWEDRDCIFVEGKETALGVGNDLFENAKSIKRILAPAVNAFHQYDDVLKECKKQEKDVLFLLALGPTATVLACDLCKSGYQAVDVGHVDLEYEWFLRGKGCRTEVVGKYNNELPGGEQPEKIENLEYWQQIIADYSNEE
ncbi:MAG: GT-D fold domain-containing glycosyltransferase [Lachnospiraceae bacterium]|nr:GT-D fold domain-containing glycosyltransferase [Lachnospiraceae bacterium]